MRCTAAGGNPAGRRASTLQRKQATQLVPLWLVAECLLDDKDRYEVAAKWFGISLEAAFRQMDQQPAISIGMQWANCLAKRERVADLENHLTRCWNESHVRPELAGAKKGDQGTAPAEVDPLDSAPEIGLQASVAPLTIPQFEAAIKISILAARSQLAELSRKAMEESLRQVCLSAI